MDPDSVYTVAASKVPMLKPGEYELWRMRMEQYIQIVDYSLWEFIENGNAPPITQVVKDAKSLLQAVEKRFGGNAATKKTQRNLLKQKYENFTASSSEVLDQEDVNQKFLRSLSPEWNTHTSVWRNKPEIDILSLDDLYNNLKIHEPKMAMLTMRAKRFLKNIRRKFSMNGNETIGFDKSKVDCYNCHKKGHFAKEYRAPRSQDTKHKESTRRIVPMETPTLAALVSCDGLGRYDWSDQAKDGLTNFALMAYSSTSSNFEVSTDSNCSSSCLENTKILKEQNEQLLKDLRTSKINDITYETEEFVNEPIVSEPTVKKPIVETSEAKASADKPKVIRKNFGPPLIEDWMSDSEDKAESNSKIEKETVKPRQFQNHKMVKPVWNYNQKVNHKIFAKKTHPRAKRNMVPRAVLMKSRLTTVNTARPVSAAHLKSTVNVARPMSYLSKLEHSSIKRPFDKKTAFTNSNVPQKVNTVRSKTINAARPKAVVNAARPKEVVNAILGNKVNAVKASACWVWKPKTKVINHVSKHNNASITLKKFDYIDAQGRSKSMIAWVPKRN
uniref:Ribonuclease H-like domain-containing protein n=1 Tax=Tanacetum cinerariifolium TaxID=118510 RepID=A0A699I1Y0_TANCI|nr:ribonuclease H-like domain-containing protein [Tanacetum cinerariifolium]